MGLLVIPVLMSLFVGAVPASAQLDRALKGLGKIGVGPWDEGRIASGLKEALRIGTENAVLQTGKVDGFFGNDAIRIPMPRALHTIETPLRFVGYGPQIDEFVLGMNRAAEKAVPFAKQIFWEAITQITFEDARRILDGGDTAATDYFRSKTASKLRAAFLPTVEKVMNEVSVHRQYNELLRRYKDIPFTRSVSFDVNQYVTERATDGLFYVLGQEEKKIRTDPAARATDLLKDVFGRR